jgi:hypothetical protein
MRFHPGGSERNGAVTARKQSGEMVVVVPLPVEVPIGTTRIELWFQNADHAGCVAWDSWYCQNYWFDVIPD